MNKASKDLSYVGGYASYDHRGELWQVQFLQTAITVVKFSQHRRWFCIA